MKNSIITLALLISATAVAQDVAMGKWRSRSIVIDGLADDWNTPLRFYNNETNLFFAMVNDSSNLYLCFQVKEEKTQIKVNRAGMQVELKGKGNLKCDATIDFPLTAKKEMVNEEGEPHREKPDIDHMKARFILQNVTMSLAGFATQNGMVPLKESRAIKAALNWDDKNVMTYELMIPLKELFGNNFSLGDVSKGLTLKVEVNGFTRPESKNPETSPSANGGGMGAGMGGAAGGSMSGMGGGMGRGGGGGGNRGGGGGHHGGQQGGGDQSTMFDKTKLKQSFYLAAKAL